MKFRSACSALAPSVSLLLLLSACRGPEGGNDKAPLDKSADQASTKATTIFDAAVGKPVTGSCTPNSMYPAEGLASLVDGRTGSDYYEDPEWMGWWYEEKPFEATVDLGTVMPIEALGVHALTTTEAWIFFPRKVEFEISTDGKTYEQVATVKPTEDDLKNEYPETKILKASNLNKVARFVRVRAERYGELPDWHMGHGGADGHEGQAWLFIDEILVNPKKK